MIIITTITAIIITIMTPATSMTSIAGIPMVPIPASSPAPAAGSAGWERSCGLCQVFGRDLVLVSRCAGLAGIAATFVVGPGTAITVATIAIAVSAKIRRSASAPDAKRRRCMRGTRIRRGLAGGLFGIGLLFGYLAAERVTCF
jgi:hypothetical protein